MNITVEGVLTQNICLQFSKGVNSEFLYFLSYMCCYSDGCSHLKWSVWHKEVSVCTNKLCLPKSQVSDCSKYCFRFFFPTFGSVWCHRGQILVCSSNSHSPSGGGSRRWSVTSMSEWSKTLIIYTKIWTEWQHFKFHKHSISMSELKYLSLPSLKEADFALPLCLMNADWSVKDLHQNMFPQGNHLQTPEVQSVRLRGATNQSP